MRWANKQSVPASTLIDTEGDPNRHRRWTNPRPTFKVLAGNLNPKIRKTPTQGERHHYSKGLFFYLQVSERLNNSQR